MFFTPIMHRTTRNPALRSFDRSFERFVNEAVQTSTAQPGILGSAFEQTETAFTLRLDVPGLTKAQLGIHIEGAIVRIESLADAPRRVKVAYELPQDIEASSSSAKLEHGVLTLTLGKKVPATTATTIQID
jgi:HSP20 family protein